MIAPPRWSESALNQGRLHSIELFRRQRMQEPLVTYLHAFAEYRRVVESLLTKSGDLLHLDDSAVAILTDQHLLEAFRYITGPPVSADDLETLAGAVLSPGRLRNEPALCRRIVTVVQAGLDTSRFPWVSESRQPTPRERYGAALASAALLASSHVSSSRRNEGKTSQELGVQQALLSGGFELVARRPIETLNAAPQPGQFCRESLLGSRKADFVVALWDRRVMAVECKVSNSAVNSVKRLNNDAAAKAEAWVHDFGRKQIVPTAVLSGVYKLHNLVDAQERGLTLFWAHDLAEMITWIRSTRK